MPFLLAFLCSAVVRRRFFHLSALRGKFWQKVWIVKLRIVYDIFDYDATYPE
jgi:hypothetical protein